MKKLALTSLLAVFAVSGAHAANVIDGNPLYMPKAGHFYSVSDLSSHTERNTPWVLAEDFGYGVSDKLAIDVSTSATEDSSFDYISWNDLSLKATFRAFQKGGMIADVYGEYGLDNIEGGGFEFGGVWPDHKPFMDEDDTTYTWTAGVRAGYTTSQWTVAGRVAFSYSNSETFNWADKGMHYLTLGLDGQYLINKDWNLVAGLEYKGILNSEWAYDDETPTAPFDPDVKNAGKLHGMLGANYNIDATKFVGAYVFGDMNHHDDNEPKDEWRWEEGFGFGAKFGIDF